MSDMWTVPEDDPRSYGNPIGEKATYREYLGNYRLIIEMKCEGLDASQLAGVGFVIGKPHTRRPGITTFAGG